MHPRDLCWHKSPRDAGVLSRITSMTAQVSVQNKSTAAPVTCKCNPEPRLTFPALWELNCLIAVLAESFPEVLSTKLFLCQSFPEVPSCTSPSYNAPILGPVYTGIARRALLIIREVCLHAYSPTSLLRYLQTHRRTINFHVIRITAVFTTRQWLCRRAPHAPPAVRVVASLLPHRVKADLVLGARRQPQLVRCLGTHKTTSSVLFNPSQ